MRPAKQEVHAPSAHVHPLRYQNSDDNPVKSGQPENKQIMAAFAVYALVVILLPPRFVPLNWPPGPNGCSGWPYREWSVHGRAP